MSTIIQKHMEKNIINCPMEQLEGYIRPYKIITIFFYKQNLLIPIVVTKITNFVIFAYMQYHGGVDKYHCNNLKLLQNKTEVQKFGLIIFKWYLKGPMKCYFPYFTFAVLLSIICI